MVTETILDGTAVAGTNWVGNGRYWQASAKIQGFNIAKQAARRDAWPQPSAVSRWPKTTPEQGGRKKYQ
ncbi:MAG: hypothetical protein IPM53_10905 [Anaerolineaceae bacterium]|nr:hypothetical protein [Anaerolineaceae bacterium]